MPPRQRKPTHQPSFLDVAVRSRFVVSLAVAVCTGVVVWAKGVADNVEAAQTSIAVIQGELLHLERTDAELKATDVELRARLEK